MKALFSARAGRHPQETPFSDDQEIRELDEGGLQVEATVNNSGQLRWWLLGFGDQVEVLEPEELRVDFRESSEEISAIYKGSVHSSVSQF